MPLIKLQSIKKVYKNGLEAFEALKGVDLEINKGEFVAIMGASGSGKSTLMHIIGCLDSPSSGVYFLNGINVAKMSDNKLAKVRNQDIGFVFQAFNLLPRITVFENVKLPFSYSTENIASQEQERIVNDALKQVGLYEKRNNKSNEISGGQTQRTAIARSLILSPSIILADEPTGNLDTKTGNEIMDIFKKLHSKGHTIILVTHEEDIASNAKRIIKLKDGLIISDNKE